MRVIAALTSLLTLWTLAAGAQTAPPRAPALVVVIAIDQFRGDYLDRFGSQFTGGLKRFHEQSAFFPHAIQDHSMTETAPGHATMLSGREPARTGIASNNRGVPDSMFALVGAAGPGASPARFMGTELLDWMTARDPGVRALSVSRKDRAAILMTGRARSNVFWFADGIFTTSRYYADTLPSWLTRFNAGIDLSRLGGTAWNLLLPPAAYSEPDSVVGENENVDMVFPHLLPTGDGLKSKITRYPVMDSLTLAAALAGVSAQSLGHRALTSATPLLPDLLTISLSTTDAIGHAYGPDSRELHDQLLHVDRWLGAFMTTLERSIPADRIAYVLTGDHGAAPMPEIARAATGRGGRVMLDDVAAEAEKALAARFGTSFDLDFDNGVVFANVTALRAHGVNVDSLAQSIVITATRQPGVRIGFTAATLATSRDSAAIRWRRSLPATVEWLAVFDPQPDYVWSSVGKLTAEHATTGPLTRSVPIAFLGPVFRAGRHDETVRTVDIAPTLAALLGIVPAEPLDGAALRNVLAPRGPIKR